MECKRSLMTFLALVGWLAPHASLLRADDPAESGFLGVSLAPLPEALSAHLDLSGGAMVERVAPGSPAEGAGLRAHDIIVSANAEPIKEPADLQKLVRSGRPGDRLKLGVKRGKETLDLEAVLGAGRQVLPREGGDKPAPAKAPKRAFLGVGFAEVPAALAAHLDTAEKGVLVDDVYKDSAAQKAGIERNDVLVAMDGKDIGGPVEFARLLSEKKPGDAVKLDLFHKGARKSVEVVLGERPSNLQGPRMDPYLPEDRFLRPDRPGRRFFNPGPGIHRRGKIILEGPDGEQQVFEFPPGEWKLDELMKDLDDRLLDLRKLAKPGKWAEKVRKLAEDVEKMLEAEGFDGDIVSSQNSSAVVRIVEGEFDITVEEVNGQRTATVKRGGEVLVEKCPYEELEKKLPPDVRERVDKVAESLRKTQPEPSPNVIRPPSEIRA